MCIFPPQLDRDGVRHPRPIQPPKRAPTRRHRQLHFQPLEWQISGDVKAIFNRGATSWRYATIKSAVFTTFDILHLSRDRMCIGTGQRLGTVAAAFDTPYTNRRAVFEFWRRDLVNAQGGTTDTLWIFPPPKL
ncbi:unnamed protein product [Amaranthus hypochondriacus]